MEMLNRFDIERILPHGPKAIIMDEVTDFSVLKGQEYIVAKVVLDKKNYGHVFEDHFPGRPIGPAHWQLEIGCLSAALLYFLIKGTLDKLIVLRKITECEFVSQVEIGDELRVTCNQVKIKRGKVVECHIEIHKPLANYKNELVMKADIVGFLVPPIVFD